MPQAHVLRSVDRIYSGGWKRILSSAVHCSVSERGPSSPHIAKMRPPKHTAVVFGIVLGYLATFVVSTRHLASRASVLLGSDVANKTYEFIVVGGGTADLTVADRLSEGSNSK